MNRRQVLLGTMVFGLLAIPLRRSIAASTRASKIILPKPGPLYACPVCGMFVARYPDWIATILYKDKHADHFDGAKDLFKYLHNMKKYAGGRRRQDIAAIGVTDYYETEMIDAQAAHYVIGSDVLSPMGHDLVPHPAREDAKEFYMDHFGKKILTFTEVNSDLVWGLDDGQF